MARLRMGKITGASSKCWRRGKEEEEKEREEEEEEGEEEKEPHMVHIGNINVGRIQPPEHCEHHREHDKNSRKAD